MRHTLSKEQCSHAFDRSTDPALEIDPGDEVSFETSDAAYERLANGESIEQIGLENVNAVTGPVLVRGAEPGDALRIDVLDVALVRGYSIWLPGFGGLGGLTDTVRVLSVPIEGGRARLSERLTVPVEPMVGCIGVAPAEGTGSTLMPAGSFGGNMDLRELSRGATLLLPVQVPGGLLSLGDLHAAMGAAEPTWVSIEAGGTATVRIGLESEAQLPCPRLRVRGETLCVGMGETLEAAHQSALDQAYELLRSTHGLNELEAYAYASARVAMRFGGPASPIVLAAFPDPEV
jgi:amidase